MTGRSLLQAVKRAARADGPVLCIPVGVPPAAILRPVGTAAGSIRADDVRCLTEWRNRFVTAFLNEFDNTEQRTDTWLREFVGPDDSRILFMLDDADGKTFGYMGLAYIDWNSAYGEADAIVKGADAPPGTMKRALRTLIDWGRNQLGLRQIGVRVRSDNPAVDFYRRFGFEESNRVGLRKTTIGADIRWVEDESLLPGSPSLVHMRLQQQD
jgi:RimJ/RimL family protein N-acetyltransferase